MAVVVSLLLGVSEMAASKTYIALGGQKVTLPDRESVLGEPALSPDGRRVAYIRAAGKPLSEDDPQPAEVVVADVVTGDTKVLVHSGAGSEWYVRPVIRVTFAADGKHLFAERTFPGTSASVHDIDLVAGKERLLGWGNDIAVLRDGPWRGDLLMGVHTCYRGHPGCDYPVHIVTSAGRSVFVVPGTAGADRASQLQAWLVKRRWRAW